MVSGKFVWEENISVVIGIVMIHVYKIYSFQTAFHLTEALCLLCINSILIRIKISKTENKLIAFHFSEPFFTFTSQDEV